MRLRRYIYRLLIIWCLDTYTAFGVRKRPRFPTTALESFLLLKPCCYFFVLSSKDLRYTTKTTNNARLMHLRIGLALYSKEIPFSILHTVRDAHKSVKSLPIQTCLHTIVFSQHQLPSKLRTPAFRRVSRQTRHGAKALAEVLASCPWQVTVKSSHSQLQSSWPCLHYLPIPSALLPWTTRFYSGAACSTAAKDGGAGHRKMNRAHQPVLHQQNWAGGQKEISMCM